MEMESTRIKLVKLNPKKEETEKQPGVFVVSDDIKTEWTSKATSSLLKLYDEKMDLFEVGVINTQKKLWQLVSKEMVENDYFYSASQCENKWKSLKRRMKEITLKRVRGKGDKRQYPFESEIMEILAKRNELPLTESQADHQTEFVSFEVPSAGPTSTFFEMTLHEPAGPSNTSYGTEIEDRDDKHFVQIPNDPIGSCNNNAFNRSSLRDEILGLKKEIIRQNVNSNANQHKATVVQNHIADYLKTLKEHSKHREETERKKIRQQDEILTYLREQNVLLKTLVERL